MYSSNKWAGGASWPGTSQAGDPPTSNTGRDTPWKHPCMNAVAKYSAPSNRGQHHRACLRNQNQDHKRPTDAWPAAGRYNNAARLYQGDRMDCRRTGRGFAFDSRRDFVLWNGHDDNQMGGVDVPYRWLVQGATTGIPRRVPALRSRKVEGLHSRDGNVAGIPSLVARSLEG